MGMRAARVASSRPSGGCRATRASCSVCVTYRSLLVTPRRTQLTSGGSWVVRPSTTAIRSTEGNPSPRTASMRSTFHRPVGPPANSTRRGCVMRCMLCVPTRPGGCALIEVACRVVVERIVETDLRRLAGWSERSTPQPSSGCHRWPWCTTFRSGSSIDRRRPICTRRDGTPSGSATFPPPWIVRPPRGSTRAPRRDSTCSRRTVLVRWRRTARSRPTARRDSRSRSMTGQRDHRCSRRPHLGVPPWSRWPIDGRRRQRVLEGRSSPAPGTTSGPRRGS